MACVAAPVLASRPADLPRSWRAANDVTSPPPLPVLNSTLIADRALTDRVVPGTRVTVVGIYAMMGQGIKGTTAGLGQPYIRVVGLTEDAGAGGRGGGVFSADEVAEFR